MNCQYRISCTGLSAAAGLILGAIAAFLQFTDALAVSAVFLWVFFGIATGLLLLLAVFSGFRWDTCGVCRSLRAVLAGALGTIVLSLVLLAVPAAIGGVLGAVLVGLLVFFFFLMIFSAACLVRF